MQEQNLVPTEVMWQELPCLISVFNMKFLNYVNINNFCLIKMNHAAVVLFEVKNSFKLPYHLFKLYCTL